MTDCVRRQDCRLCGGHALTKVFSLVPTPPANAFVPKADVGKPQAAFPLDLFFCESCGHVQLLDVVDPAVLFENYVYVSGTSPVFVKHFEDYAATVMETYKPEPGALALDIGSNDGTLLGFFQKAGLKVLGVDPAKEIAADATARGIETLTGFFSHALAQTLRAERGGASVITANNVFAHIDDLRGVTAGVRELLADDGVFAFEVSYLQDVIDKTLFDTIYHEHLCYHGVKPLVRFFRDNGMEMIAAHRIDSHGGSLRGFAQLAGGPHQGDGSVDARVAEEVAAGFDRAATFRAYADKIDRLKSDLNKLLGDLLADGKKIAAYGAPAKMTTLMHHFGLGPEQVAYIVDDSPLKQGLYSPGFHIPVVPSSHMEAEPPDCLLILAWNFADPIMAKQKAFSERGGTFIVPLPELRTV